MNGLIDQLIKRLIQLFRKVDSRLSFAQFSQIVHETNRNMQLLAVTYVTPRWGSAGVHLHLII